MIEMARNRCLIWPLNTVKMRQKPSRCLIAFSDRFAGGCADAFCSQILKDQKPRINIHCAHFWHPQTMRCKQAVNSHESLNILCNMRELAIGFSVAQRWIIGHRRCIHQNFDTMCACNDLIFAR
ncbi:hypothetical protein D9M69_631630 [compost metagenome]